MKIVAGKLGDIQQLFQKEVKVSCCSLENTASAGSRKYFVDRGCFPHEQLGCHRVLRTREAFQNDAVVCPNTLMTTINIFQEVRTVAPGAESGPAAEVLRS